MTWSNVYWSNYWFDGYWYPGSEVPDPCPAFRLFKQDCEMEIKGWGDQGAYARVSPFGGPHQDPPSGAEI